MMDTQLIVGLLGGGGILGGFVALFKMRPENTRIIVSAAEGAVVVQTKTITNLVNEVERLHEEVANERRNCDERLAEQDQEIHRLREEVNAMREIFTLIDDRKGVRRGSLPTDVEIIPADMKGP